MNQESRINITGKNFLIASSVGLIVAIVLTGIYTLMAAIVAGSDGTFVSVEWVTRRFFSLFKVIGICVVPLGFLITFALLQRFRIKR